MTNAIDSFVSAENVSLYKTLLRKETHPDKRRVLLELLANEFAKLPESVKRLEMKGVAGFK
jgi:hypothetical protein